ncbi:MAG: acyl-CoA dehydrogenase [Alphaproteobacteria bacterium]|nr:acyl-CoA dehydrogenase [Alphaproteobacteria bacterium]NCQ88777.1 acyl-CoA dehydrogenase [Alphaproteobacteria bacterium]NCT07300.1 acyl-CoA dehydrogenase [Alphaproteobacteria bacterium]
MSDYHPPLKDMRFILDHVVGLESLPEHPDLGRLDGDMIDSVLEPAAKLASEVLAPLNWTGDQEGCTLTDGHVKTATGFKEAYAQYRDGGWNAVPFDSNYGGQALPWLVAFPLQEMWQGANMSFGLCPLLNQGAVEAIHHHGSQEQKDYYLEKLISGQWTGTMNLTEPQAGSDLSAIRSKAEPQDDGSYKVFGQKIYITYGEHDMAENIIHLVLARTPDAPEGVKGISLFIVPKILQDGTRNDVICTGIEHKLGIHASPTCTMQFGDKGGAIGYLVGTENEGLKYMFTMMNNARLSVGLQGVAIAERAYQHALYYAKDREQGAALTDKTKRITISEHADVKRMLMSMKAQIEAARALTYEAALALDMAANGDETAQAKVDILTPIVKACCTDMSLDVTSTGLQIHGGMGFVEETGAAQYYRDARILPIYEGTNGIQAMDLAFRKTLRDGGASVKAYIADLKIRASGHAALENAIAALSDATHWMIESAGRDLDLTAASSVPYLKCFGLTAMGVMMKKSADKAQKQIAAGASDKIFYAEKINTAEFYMTHLLPLAMAHKETVIHGAQSVKLAQF